MLPIRNVVVGISGGVDSAVAALLLKKKGFNVIGAFMRNWDLTDETGVCAVEADYEDAKYVCSCLKIPIHEINFVKEYWNSVFDVFLNDYENDFTPNPDILCNKFIKFKKFLDYAINNLNADAIATGHYAKTSFGDYLENYQPNTNVKLLQPKDLLKDQTFFLSQVYQESLRKVMFPLSGFTKDTVKKIAAENGLEKIAKKPESTGICFIGKRKFSQFLTEYVTPRPGKFIEMFTGKVIGEHQGKHLWTLGQRTRLSSNSEASYVAKKIQNSLDIYVVFGLHHPSLYSSMFFTDKPHWIAESPALDSVNEVYFRFQHVRSLTKCSFFQLKSGGLFTTIVKPLRALTPGQYAVYYKDGECLGSAKITEIGPSEFSLGNAIPEKYQEYENVETWAISNQ